MSFVLCKDSKPIVQVGGGSDVIHINGIGGLGYRWIDKREYPKTVEPIDWSIDCLKVSGLFRLFCSRYLISGTALSSYEIFSSESKFKNNQP